MLALNKAGALLWMSVASVILYGGVVFVASSHGLVVIAFSVCGAYLLLLLASYQINLKPALGLAIVRLGQELAPALTGCAALVAIDLALRTALVSLPAVVIATVAGATGLIVYALVLRWFFPQAYADLATLLTRLAPERLRAWPAAWIRRRRRATLPDPVVVGTPAPVPFPRSTTSRGWSEPAKSSPIQRWRARGLE